MSGLRFNVSQRETPISVAKAQLPLPDLMHRLGLGEHAKKSAHCPFHDDKNKSFSVYQTANGNCRWKCHAGCGEGDEIDFIARVRDTATSEACRVYIDLAGVNRNATTDCRNQARQNKQPSKPSHCPTDIYLPTDEQCRQVCTMSDRLAGDDELLEKIAKARGWKKDDQANRARRLLGLVSGQAGFHVRHRRQAEMAAEWRADYTLGIRKAVDLARRISQFRVVETSTSQKVSLTVSP